MLSYTRTGFLTAMHDAAPAEDGTQRVVTVEPARDDQQVSWLRIVNPGMAIARVTITGTDDAGAASTKAAITVPPGAARKVTVVEFQPASPVGSGSGKWQLDCRGTSSTSVRPGSRHHGPAADPQGTLVESIDGTATRRQG